MNLGLGVGEVMIDPRFLRPLWLLALLGLPLLWWWLRRRGHGRAEWQRAIDPHLLPHLLAAQGGTRMGRLAPWLWCLGYALAAVALAGPSWRAKPQPLLQDRSPLVIALDLSSAIEARDLPPNRLARARAEIQRILDRRAGQIALVAYAEDAFTVVPLTDDAANIALFLSSLGPQVMPLDTTDGEPGRADRAIDEAQRLMRRAGFGSGEILLIAADASDEGEDAADRAAEAGFRVSVLGLGTLRGGMFRDREGAEFPARLAPAALRALAAAGGGGFAAYSDDDRDLEALGVFDSARIAPTVSGRRGALEPLDDGYWLLPPLLLLALFAFRRGVLTVALAFCLLPLSAPPASAAGLWQREDQRQHAQLRRGYERYGAREYQRALEDWQDLPGAEAAYNRGNALARMGKYPEAVAEYDRALALKPGMVDAVENRRIVLEAMRKPPPPPKPKPKDKKQEQKEQGGKSKDDPKDKGQAKDQGDADNGGGRQDRPEGQGGQQNRQDRQETPQDKPQQGGEGGRSRPQPQSEQAGRQNRQGERDQAQAQARQQGAAGKPDRSSGQAPGQGGRDAGNEARDRQQGVDGPDPDRDPRADAEQQRRADAAQRERMQRALAAGAGDAREKSRNGGGSGDRGGDGGDRPESAAERQQRQLIEARLRRVEDKPGDLLRMKFELEHARRKREGER